VVGSQAPNWPEDEIAEVDSVGGIVELAIEVDVVWLLVEDTPVELPIPIRRTPAPPIANKVITMATTEPLNAGVGCCALF